MRIDLFLAKPDCEGSVEHITSSRSLVRQLVPSVPNLAAPQVVLEHIAPGARPSRSPK